MGHGVGHEQVEDDLAEVLIDESAEEWDNEVVWSIDMGQEFWRGVEGLPS
ncbi:MAG TPA: hypothetical protein VHV53_06250 [Solirubrobacterales bacterium]|jgi:hypothetical protein|nr:hypothetical protein [Solirubrobacterales bacterium]